MNKRLISVMFLLCLAFFMVIQTARAQTITPGVKTGDDYIYTIISSWSSSNPYDSIPQDLVTANQTSSFEVRISDANDTYVTTFTATYYTDGTTNAARGTLNVQTGETTDGGFPAIIGANLNPGDKIHPSADAITINDTVIMNSRPTNEININFYNSSSGLTSSDDRFFDQATGMLVKEIESSIDGGAVSGYTGTSTVTTQIKSSPWAPAATVTTPEFPPIFALSIIITATTLAIIAFKKKHVIVGNPAINA